MITIFLVANLGDAKVIVGDVILGVHTKVQTKHSIPVMYQEETSFKSDFSLDEFITEAIKYQNSDKQNPKIFVLNFLSETVLPQTIDILGKKRREV